MIYFISDLHLGHSRIAELCHRPFESVEKMDSVLIENWSRRVKKCDTVYIVGDIVWDKRRVDMYMERLSGKKILIYGNHDSDWARRAEVRRHFEDVVQYLEIHHCGHPITLCHYPMLEWRGSRDPLGRKVGYHIHGHIHNRVSDEYRALYTHPCAFNAGVDINDFKPVTLSELIENNLRFKLAVLPPAERERLILNTQILTQSP